MVNFMNAIQKYIRNKRYKKYLKLKQEFSDLEPPKIRIESRNIYPLKATRYIDTLRLSGEDEEFAIIKHYKEEIIREFGELAVNFEVYDSEKHPHTKVVRGTLYVAKKEGM